MTSPTGPEQPVNPNFNPANAPAPNNPAAWQAPRQQPAPNYAPQQAAAPVVIHAESSMTRWMSRLGWFGCFVFGTLFIGQWSTMQQYFDKSGGIAEKYHSGEKYAQDKVAIIDVTGVIMESEGYVKHQIDRIKEDENVKAVVVRVDSPGGTVTGSDYIFHHLKKLKSERKMPLVVSMGSIAASGGYYVAMAVGDQDKAIFAEPTTTTGSIGVIIPHYDVSGLMQRFDIKDDSIASHPRKQLLSMTKSMSDEDRQILQSYVNEAFSRFTDIVKEGRPVFTKDEDALRQLATGEVFTANQAKKHGLVDEIGFIEDAVDRAMELAKLDKNNTRVVRFERPVSLLGLGGLSQSSVRTTELTTLLELASPRAYYLSTTLPTLLTTRRAN